MYEEGVKYALNGIAKSGQKSFCQPFDPNQGYQQLV